MSTNKTNPMLASVPAVTPDEAGGDSRRIDRFLHLMMERGASDLHLSVGRPPMFRLGGEMDPIRYRTIGSSDFESMIRPITPGPLWKTFDETGDIDFAYQLGQASRFRVNLFRQERGAGAVFRVIPTKILSLEQLALPPQVGRLARLSSGLVLVTGPTGSGKSTTLAAIIDLVNRTRDLHIITIEDPIEFVHPNKRCLVHQREIGPHARSFPEALRVAVREDPDIVLVGEMRDLVTITMALEAAEKGMLVFGTLHTNNAAKTIDRIVNVFPSGEQEGIRQILGETVRGIVAQQLLPKVGGGRVAALEILFGSPQVGSMIREGKVSALTSHIQTGKKEGMISMDQSIANILEAGLVTPEAALDKAIDKPWMRKVLGMAEEEPGGGHGGGGAGHGGGMPPRPGSAGVRPQAGAPAPGARPPAPAAPGAAHAPGARPPAPGADAPPPVRPIPPAGAPARSASPPVPPRPAAGAPPPAPPVRPQVPPPGAGAPPLPPKKV